ncbi:MAG: aminoglycoside phosphotransferase family protein [Anaerolineales bacterium]|nr:aminoglycoside phosphotransferase family protein [Anaerolineales bacterium]
MEYLTGGRENQIVRSGKLLYRPAGFWSPSVHLLLKHVRRHGFCGVPEPLGFADDGREILTFIDGEVSNYPLSPAAASQEALESAAQLLHAYHEASASFLPDAASLQWMLPPQEPAEVICHGDFAPYNVVLAGDTAVAIIDFDTAYPGPRIWDVAYGAYRWVPLHNPQNPAGLADLDIQIQRTKLFCDAYGLPGHDRLAIIDVTISRLQALIDFMQKEAAQGSKTFQAHLAAGHHLVYRDDMAFLRDNQAQIIQGLL